MRMSKLWRRMVDFYVARSFRRPVLSICVVLVLTLGCAWFAVRNLEVVTDLATLLPEGSQSVAALDESRRRVGSTDFFTIAIESTTRDPHAIARLQDELARRIRAEWSDARWVQVGRDTDFFREHALYYLPDDDLIELRDLLEEELIRQSSKVLPGMVNLLDDEEQHGSASSGRRLEDWYDDDLPQRLGLPLQVADEFHRFFGRTGQSDRTPGRLPADLAGRLIGPLGDVGVVLVQLAEPSTDLDYAKNALARGKRLIDDVDPRRVDPSLEAQVVGAYRSFEEVDAVAGDGATATGISVTLVLILMLAFFRSPRIVLVVVVPLAAAGAATMALTALVYGRLTVLTVFVLAMLVGMGIDFGIHLYGRLLIELRAGQTTAEATRRSLVQCGPALLAAAATTVAALLMLLLGHFEGFVEFAVVASYGLGLCLVLTLLIVPPLVRLMELVRPISVRRAAPAAERRRGGLATRLVAAAFGVGVLLTLGAVWFAPRVEFEYDFRNLRGPKTGATIGYGRAIGRDASTTPAVILGQSREQMRRVHDRLKERAADPSSRVKSFITYATFVPRATDQQRRLPLIREIGEIASKRAFERLKGENRRLVDELRRMTRAERFDHRHLPEWARRIVGERDGTVGRIGHVYARVSDWDAVSVRELKDELAAIGAADESVPVACSSFILSDVIAMVQRDGAQLALSASAALLVILALFTRRVGPTLVLAATIGCAALWTAGVMALAGVRLGLYNLIAIPVMLGVGIDGAIHLYHGHRRHGRDGLVRNLRTTGRLITASAFTTMAGFSGLVFVSHQGLRTIGVLAGIGVGLGWLAVMVLLPFVLSRLPFGRGLGRGQ
jgi:predicted RND superfamily exporter protein